jgi:hypothetical protein
MITPNKIVIDILHKMELQGEGKYRYQIGNYWYSGNIDAQGLLKKKVRAEYSEVPNPKSQYAYRNIISIDLVSLNETKTDSKDDYWLNQDKRDILAQKHILRHGAINTALELKRLADGATTGIKPGMTVKTILKEAEELAEDIILFVTKDD